MVEVFITDLIKALRKGIVKGSFTLDLFLQ